MLLMVEKSVKGRICQAIYRYRNANKKTHGKIVIKINHNHIVSIRMGKTCMDEQCYRSYL